MNHYSAEWLAQSSSQTSTEIAEDMHSKWNQEREETSSCECMPLSPEIQSLITSSIDIPPYCKVTYMGDDQNFSSSKDLYQMDKESNNSLSNVADSLDGTSMSSINTQESMSSSEESSPAHGEQSKETSAHSGCITDNNNSGNVKKSQSTTPSQQRGGSKVSTKNNDVQIPRLRTAFTPEQIKTLENAFAKHKYLGTIERDTLSMELNLDHIQIKTWFQNRRMKQKREAQDGRLIYIPPPPIFPIYGYPTRPLYQRYHTAQPLYTMDYMPYYSRPPAPYDYYSNRYLFPSDYNRHLNPIWNCDYPNLF